MKFWKANDYARYLRAGLVRAVESYCLKCACASALAAPGGTLTKPAARCYPWPATNNKAPACSWRSGPGVFYVLWGVLWVSVRRFRPWEYIGTLSDTKTALRASKWHLRRSCLFGRAPPRWTRAQKCRLRAVGGHTSGGKPDGNKFNHLHRSSPPVQYSRQVKLALARFIITCASVKTK